MDYKKDDYDHMSFMERTSEKCKMRWRNMSTSMRIKWASAVIGSIITSIAGLVTIYINIF